MPVRFEGPNGTEELIPAPFVSIQKSPVRDSAGNILRSEYNITLTGTIVNVGNALINSPAASGYTFGNMEGVLDEQRRIRSLFSVDGGRLEIETPGGGGANTIDAYCLVNSLDFSPSTWTTKCEYTVGLSAKQLFPDPETTSNIESPNETWSIAEQTDGTFVFTHQLSAIGVRIYDGTGVNDPLLIAKEWCRDRSYYLSGGTLTTYTGASGSVDINSVLSANSGVTNFWNYSLSESPGPGANSWEITETMLHYPGGNAREEYVIAVNFDENNAGRCVATINGSVIGYADTDRDYTTKMANATSKWNTTVIPNLYTRVSARAPAGFSVIPTATQRQVSYESTVGAIRYGYTYSCASGNMIENSLAEDISITDVAPTDVFAQINVPGRANGPVVQYMHT